MGPRHDGILCDIADAAIGIAVASTLAQEESFTTVELKINFFRPVWQARLAARSGMGVHSNRRGEPIGRESGFHVHGASRPEGIRPAIPLSFSSAHSAQRLQPTGFRALLENLAAVRRY
jgi:Thioesterase superfamily